MIWDDPFLDALEPMLDKFRDTKERRESLVLLKAMRLAPDLETCEELLRGKIAPKSRIVPEWAKAYGLR